MEPFRGVKPGVVAGNRKEFNAKNSTTIPVRGKPGSWPPRW